MRRKAREQLEELGDQVVPALREVLAGNPSPGMRQRVAWLWPKLQHPGLEHLRVLRALEALEHIGTAEVRPILERIAHGAADDRLRQQARGSLRRLSRSAR